MAESFAKTLKYEEVLMVDYLGINVPLMVTATYGFGGALAAVAGVLAAPVIQVSPLWART